MELLLIRFLDVLQQEEEALEEEDEALIKSIFHVSITDY